uniref:Uncharacterized protein n=1 Tax=Anguilla anguilla TaxID=7936 RepID=A0A0E9VS85_ANGAN
MSCSRSCTAPLIIAVECDVYC